MSKTVFLETHNLKNKATGLGTFNYELIKGLYQLDFNDLKLTLNAKNPEILEAEFGNKFSYNKYNSLSRHSIFRTRKKHDLWHSVNQNTKVEPFRVNKYLLTIHDVNFVEEISSDMNHKANKLFVSKLEKSTAITYISEFAKKQTHQYFKVPNVPEYVIHNGNPITTILDTSNFVSNIPLDKPFLYSIGDFLERKNFLSIAKMMMHITDFNLIISGNNNKPYGIEIATFITENNLQNRVFLTGKVDDIAKQFYLSKCYAFLFPSIREGFGLPPIEAMHFGKPVFLSNKTSLPEIGGENAYYWDNFDPEYMKTTLTDGLNHFYNNQNEMELLMKERAASFNWKVAAAEYLKVYHEILR
ncbi:glycosyltransferase family 4 protein [Flavobacterium gawalongense]|uniref:Glycosyltransferase family 4 protein n=1 Tax=Flavobacterium gawalongense TaxID=2594432 RepID=A0A553BV63_9FLAO|nr:glycosyltransferase family 1 protein [Flavobacterium gawalongense]TRX02779.1 glycosyltransferase family 4 protein [Flavobacterium gawalongense]TRX08087.1 glycosyltransferase family 4 protein [Flavobacterium gawalongense]TRX11365.1 glycosyltransferase family 4 protein [Flavobacterium gawalongense]TRX12123.1 glycosyltransferase family 4 protein [Flavobacterium gawalongense]TRX29000.1 glycosyltransferase family 4 protein [Flavobacterium gawalongense]